MDAIRKDSEKFDAELWAELYTLRAAVKGPDGYTSWQDAAVDERMKRHAAERTLASKEAELAAREAEIARFQETLADLKWRVDDIRDRLLGGGTGHSVYGIDEWSEPAVNLRLASKKIDAALTKQPPTE